MSKLIFYWKHLFIFFSIFFITFADNTYAASSQVSDNTENKQITSMLVWFNEAMVRAFTFNYVTYDKNFQAASPYFTDDAWRAFKKYLTDTGDMEAVMKKKLVASAVAAGTPVMLDQKMFDGRMNWKVQMPLLITFENANGSKKDTVLATASIMQTSGNIGVRGYIIKDLSISPYTLNH